MRLHNCADVIWPAGSLNVIRHVSCMEGVSAVCGGCSMEKLILECMIRGTRVLHAPLHMHLQDDQDARRKLYYAVEIWN